MTNFICISGRARSGKDTTAGMMQTFLNADGKKVLVAHYADLVKHICRAFFGWDGKKDERGRSLLQRVGTDLVRTKDPNYWVDFIIEMVQMFPGEWEYVVIPDTRFPNEIERLKEVPDFNVVHVRITRPGFDNSLTEEQRNHPSETALNDVAPDYEIVNTDMKKLISDVRELTEVIRKRMEEPFDENSDRR